MDKATYEEIKACGEKLGEMYEERLKRSHEKFVRRVLFSDKVTDYSGLTPLTKLNEY